MSTDKPTPREEKKEVLRNDWEAVNFDSETVANQVREMNRLRAELEQEKGHYIRTRDDLDRVTAMLGAATEEVEQARARIEALEKAAHAVKETWGRQCGRVFESMGSDNPRAIAINEAIEGLSALLEGKC